MIERGSIGWVETGDAKDRFPVVVVQSDPFNRSRIPTVLVVPLAAGSRLADAPGNVLVPASASGLPRETVANVAQVLTVERRALRTTGRKLSGTLVERVADGLRLVLGLDALA